MSQFFMSKKMSRMDKDQIERFRETARAIGADENEAAFKAKLAVIARHKPKEGPNLSKPEAGPDAGNSAEPDSGS